jgi:hypothetical protein
MGDDVNEPLHLETDGTAINWDTERTRTALDFDATDCVVLGCGVFFLAMAVIGVIGTFQGWWAA